MQGFFCNKFTMTTQISKGKYRVRVRKIGLDVKIARQLLALASWVKSKKGPTNKRSKQPKLRNSILFVKLFNYKNP